MGLSCAYGGQRFGDPAIRSNLEPAFIPLQLEGSNMADGAKFNGQDFPVKVVDSGHWTPGCRRDQNQSGVKIGNLIGDMFRLLRQDDEGRYKNIHLTGGQGVI